MLRFPNWSKDQKSSWNTGSRKPQPLKILREEGRVGWACFLTLIYGQLRAVHFCHTQLIRYAGTPRSNHSVAVSIQQVPGPCFANIAGKVVRWILDHAHWSLHLVSLHKRRQYTFCFSTKLKVGKSVGTTLHKSVDKADILSTCRVLKLKSNNTWRKYNHLRIQYKIKVLQKYCTILVLWQIKTCIGGGKLCGRKQKYFLGRIAFSPRWKAKSSSRIRSIIVFPVIPRIVFRRAPELVNSVGRRTIGKRVVFQVGRHSGCMYTVESRLSRWLLFLPSPSLVTAGCLQFVSTKTCSFSLHEFSIKGQSGFSY